MADRYFNRENSWLEFNARVLEEAKSADTPLLEKLRFLSIFSMNLDEFFMVRVAGLKALLRNGSEFSDDNDTGQIENIDEILRAIHEKSDNLVSQQYDYLTSEVLPQLDRKGIKISAYSDLTSEQKKRLTGYFLDSILPVLTPLAVDSSHPFPFLTNLAVYLIVQFDRDDYGDEVDGVIGFVEIPSVFPRLVAVEDDPEKHSYVMLDELVQMHLSELFVGYRIKSATTLRVTRNLDYYLIEDQVVDLLESVQKEVLNREHQEAVRLEVCGQLSASILSRVLQVLRLRENDVYRCKKLLCIPDLMQVYDLPFPDLKEKAFNPRIPVSLADSDSLFAIIQRKDLLLHHPYDSFFAVASFLSEAVKDPDVLAIKQTLYRSSGKSPILELLIKASEAGKHVTAVVELKARFDEKNNIVWARRLERAGVNVVYGFVGLKTHCKACLVVRKEGSKLARYVHLSTGNYNAQTAKSYTDIGFYI